ncbi:MAG: hypothetical protein QOE82_3216 [Thermoanaerobaculia bacterium]|jgi:uncharacterized RDD family membrane protein YckC|nr:hypothetical protein [Thermoanaerobaculia bacterium]
MICRNHVDVSEGVRRCSRCGSTFCSDCLVEIGGAPYCAVCKNEQLLDVRSGVSGPLDLAPLGRRIGAYLLDCLILYFLSTGVGFVMAAAVRAGRSPVLGCVSILVSLLVTIAYDGILTATKGQTLGKLAVRIKVVSETGADVTTGQAWGRAFAKLIPFAQFVALFNNERKGIHDMLAHTRVVNWS